jgi:hypothetical protein
VFLPGFQKGWAQFRPKAICVVARKNVNKLEKLLGSIKCFPISFANLRQFRWLLDGAGNIMTNKKKERAGHPLGVKGHGHVRARNLSHSGLVRCTEYSL